MVCKRTECDEPVHVVKAGLCRRHYLQAWRSGEIPPRTPKPPPERRRYPERRCEHCRARFHPTRAWQRFDKPSCQRKEVIWRRSAQIAADPSTTDSRRAVITRALTLREMEHSSDAAQ